jgi:L-lactate dehydrogenase
MKVGIIGAGRVGSTAAFSLIMRGVGREIVLVDVDKARANAEAQDLNHAVPFANPLTVRSGDYADLAGAKVVIITAGVARAPGESRLELLARNAAVFRQVVPQVLQHAPDTVLLITTNPVDVMTHLAAQFARELGVPSGRVLGSGTTLDTARFRSMLGQHLDIDPEHVHAYVLGEHGDSEVVPFSPVTVGNIPLRAFCDQWNICLEGPDMKRMADQVRYAGAEVIKGKGATYYGIGSALTKIVEVILGDQRALLTVCTPLKEVAGVKDVTLSLPQLVGGKGAVNALNVPLNDEEASQLHNSAKVIREAIEHLA